MQKGYGRITYLEPLYQLQRLAVILVCFEDDICQFMYDHIQRALVFNGFGKVKLKKKKHKRKLLSINGGREAHCPKFCHHIGHLLYTLPLFWHVIQIPDNWHFIGCQETLLRYLFLSNVHLIPWKGSEIAAKHPSSKGLSVLLLHLETVFPSLLSSLQSHVYATQKDCANKNYHH